MNDTEFNEIKDKTNLTIDDDLDISSITKLPDNLTINGSLYDSCSKYTD